MKENHLAQPSPLGQASQPRQHISLTAFVFLTVMALIACGGGSGLAYYATVFHPAELHAQATTVARVVLTAQAQSDIQATAIEGTIGPQELYDQITSEKPMLEDSLNGSGPLIWSNDSHSCVYIDGTYHDSVSAVSPPQKNHLDSNYCFASQLNLSNFVFQMQVAIVSGDMGGLLFRSNFITGQCYLFGFSQDGIYSFFNWDGNNYHILVNDSSLYWKKGLNQINLIAVIAHDSNIYLFVNRQYIGNVNDNTYNSGLIGVFVSESHNPTEAAFSNMQVWTF